VKLSAAIMAHPSRVDWVKHLQRRLGLPSDRVVWDRGRGIWDTASRAWTHHAPDATHHLVIQDDALVCRDLLAGLERGIDSVSGRFLCLYVGTPHDGAKGAAKVDRLTARADAEHASWIALGSSRWGLATVLPVAVIDEMLRWSQGRTEPDDQRIGLFCRDRMAWKAWHPWPSLVDHRSEGSLVGHSRTVARRFIGEDASALDFDWTGPVVS
jgi:hypothetical protein